jgi:phosphotransferase system  glucose/maltose/N-acetylglucosamine-specific IIC component
MGFVFEELIQFFQDLYDNKIPWDQLFLLVIGVVALTFREVYYAVKKKQKVVRAFFEGLLAGVILPFVVMIVLRLLLFLLENYLHLSIHPDELTNVRWYMLVSWVILLFSPWMLLVERKETSRKSAFLLSIVNIPFFILIYWMIALFWKPDVQVHLAIQVCTGIVLTAGMYLLFLIDKSEKKRREKAKRKRAAWQEAAEEKNSSQG